MRRLWGRIRKNFMNMNRLVLFLAGLLVFMGYMILIYIGALPSGIEMIFEEYFDMHLLLWLALLFLFVMLVNGLWKDFINGFRLVLSKKKNITRMELQKAANALETARRILILESVIAVAFYMVHLLYDMAEPLILLGPLLSMVLLSIAYSGLFSLITIPLRIKLENMAISFMEETDEVQGQDDGSDGGQDGQTVYFKLRAMGLTDREAEVARLVCCGLANKEIGQILYISDTTVKKHMTHILEKTKCDGREALAEMIMGRETP